MSEYISKIQQRYENSIESIKSPEIKKFFIEIWDELMKNYTPIYRVSKQRRIALFQMVYKIKDLDVSEVTWQFLCDDLHSNEVVAFACCRLLYYLLDNNLYHNEFADKLYEYRECFNISSNYRNSKFADIFIYDNFKYLFFKGGTGRRYYMIMTNVPALWDLLSEFCKIDAPNCCQNPALFYEHFTQSLGDYADEVNNIHDFSCKTFIHQTEYFKTFGKYHYLLILNRFYVFLIQHPSGDGTNIFLKIDNIELSFLKRDDFASKTFDGYKPHYYNPMIPVPSDDKWILHINGFERTSTKTNSTTSKAYDFTIVRNPFYRKLLKQCIWSESPNNFSTKYNRYIVLKDILNFISHIKAGTDYPNPDVKSINIQEANIIRYHIDNSGISAYTKNSIIHYVRGFFAIQDTNKTINFEIMVFDYLRDFGRVKESKAEAIPDEDLARINAVMKSKAEKSYFAVLCYAVFHLCLQTEFRVSQICHLKADCVVNSMKEHQYIIKTFSKTSNSQEYPAIISNLSKTHIDDILKQSESVRDECPNGSVKEYLFIYKSQQNVYKPVDAANFRKFISDCCTEAGVKQYNANNLRDTHMTKAEEYRMRHNESDAVLGVLSGHKRVDVTHNHYIETELIKMLESTYGIIFGDVDVNGEIVESIEDESIANKEHAVEQGCGFCKEEVCYIQNSISCLMCKSFITSISHEKEFSDMIHRIDDMIADAPIKHDKEDLMNIKRLYGAYLLEIWKRKGACLDE